MIHSSKSIVSSSINILADVEPVPFKRVAGKRQKFTPKRYADFKDQLGFIAKAAMNGRAPLDGAVKIDVTIFRNINPTSLNFGDADNHLKAVADALNGICYLDDRQITDAHVTLERGTPRIIIQLEEF